MSNKYDGMKNQEAMNLLSLINAYILKGKQASLTESMKDKVMTLCDELGYCGGYWKEHAANLRACFL